MKRNKKTKLDQSRIKLDEEDKPLLKLASWFVSISVGGTRIRGWINGEPVSLSRSIMKPPSDLIVDHINGDVLDNRRINLRIVTRRANVLNRSDRKLRRLSNFKGELDKTRHLNKHLSDTQYYVHVIILRTLKALDTGLDSVDSQQRDSATDSPAES